MRAPLCRLGLVSASSSRGSWAPCQWCSWARLSSRGASGPCGPLRESVACQTSGRQTWPSPGPLSCQRVAAPRHHTVWRWKRSKGQVKLLIDCRIIFQSVYAGLLKTRSSWQNNVTPVLWRLVMLWGSHYGTFSYQNWTNDVALTVVFYFSTGMSFDKFWLVWSFLTCTWCSAL